MKLTEETCNELYAACKAAWGQCMVLAPYLTQPHKSRVESVQDKCKEAIDRADAEGNTQND